MTRIRLGWAVVASTAFVLANCSGNVERSSTDAGVGGDAGSGGADAEDDGVADAAEEASSGAYTPTPNGVAMSEFDACTALLDAFAENIDRLGCSYVAPDCPAYLRNSGAPICSEYDEGTVRGCAEFYSVFTSCAEFQSRPCHIDILPDSAPNGCDADAD